MGHLQARTDNISESVPALGVAVLFSLHDLKTSEPSVLPDYVFKDYGYINDK